MTRIAVVDHGAGNLVSIAQGLEAIGAAAAVVTDPAGTGRRRRHRAARGRQCRGGLRQPGGRRVRRTARGGPPLPLLGVCVGLQLLFDGSDEDDAGGLGCIPGRVRRAARRPPAPPHRVERPRGAAARSPARRDRPRRHLLLRALLCRSGRRPGRWWWPPPSTAAPSWPWPGRGSAAGVQFHPERSGPVGLRVLANFAAQCAEAADAA